MNDETLRELKIVVERAVGRELEVVFLDLRPDGRVDPLGIERIHAW